MAIWHGNPTLDLVREAQRTALAAHLGIEISELGDDYLCGTMPVTANHTQPYGILHGGASVVLAETLGSTAATLAVDRSRFICVGQEINANHLRAVPAGSVVSGTARPIHVGARSHVWGIEIRDERGRLVCISRLTIAVLEQASPVRVG